MPEGSRKNKKSGIDSNLYHRKINKICPNLFRQFYDPDHCAEATYVRDNRTANTWLTSLTSEPLSDGRLSLGELHPDVGVLQLEEESG